MSESACPIAPRRSPHLLALEPRMMFDAAAAVVVRDAAGDAHDPVAVAFAGDGTPVPAPTTDAHPATQHAASRPVDHALPATGSVVPPDLRLREPAQTTGHDRREAVVDRADVPAPRDIIFLDTAVDDYRQLAAEWAGRGEIVLIDGTRDGLAQMQAALAGQHDIGAIHIVSHGAQGVFWLGTTRIDEASIAGGLAGALGAIGGALRPGGDILIYGCDFGEGADGTRALTALADATHADVAASTDTTGYAGRGADWTLEAKHGAIEARALDSADWVHTLDPNTPVPIAVTADSLTVTNGAGTVVVNGTIGYGSDARSPDVGQGAVALWHNAATYMGQSVDLRATVVSLSAGDAIRFNRPTGTGMNGDDPTFLLRDLTTANDATVQIRWELVLSSTGAPLPADVRFTIADIDGIGGNPNTRESVTAATTGLAYFTRERVSDINFTSSLSAIAASGTQNENTVAGAPITSASAATFDWSAVSSFTLTYKLTTNAVTTQAQFYHDGDADFLYTDPVYVSIPRLDLDRNDGTAAGNDAHFTFTEDGPAVPIVDGDVVVSNPMDINSVTGATVKLDNYKPGDTFAVGALPAGISASIGPVAGGTVTIALSGTASEQDYAAALRAITFRNTSDTPDTTQRVIEVTFSNDTLTSATAISRIDVVPVDDAPAPVGTLPARATSDAATVSYATASAFADPDGDTLGYTATGLPAGLAINAASGVISGTIDRSASQVGGGSYAVVVTARDPSGASATQTFAIMVGNPAPTAVNDSASTTEDTPVTVAVLPNDSDPDGDPLTVTAASALHGSVVRNADGTLSYAPNANYNGSDTINYTISDGQGGTASATVAVTITPVNDAPTTIGTLPARATSDATSVSYATASGFNDVDGDTLTYSATGLPTGLSINASSGVISGTVDRSASQVGGGSYAVTVTARDPAGATATQGFVLTVANPGPTAVNDSATTNEDTVVIVPVLPNDSDPDGDPLTVTAASALHGSVVRNADGTLSYTPAADYAGPDTISYTISDGQGGVANATVAVTVAAVNDAPDRVGILPARATSDAASVSYPTAGGFSDRDGDTLTYAASGLPAGLAIDPATGVISGTVDRSASQVGGGSYAVVVTARDPSGASAAQTFTITVGNPLPTAVNDSATTNEDTPVTVAVLTNDSDPDGDPLTVTAASALHGAVVRNANGTLTYTPNANYNGSDTINYTISDGQGGTASATVAVTIVPVNDAPTRVGTLPPRGGADAATVVFGTAGGFADIDGDALTYAASGLPAGLTIDAATGIVSGTLDRSASQTGGGSYAVVVTARDASGASATQSFVYTATNPAPVAVNDSATTDEDMPVTIAVLANDRDPDGDPLTVTAASALHGTVIRNADGTLTYTPAADYNGNDTIRYTISDGQGGTADATVAVTVTPLNDTPRAVVPPPGYTVPDGGNVSLAIANAFVDPDGDTLIYSANGLPAGLTLDSATGSISGTLDRSASQVGGGVYTVALTARDPSGATATQTVTLTATNPAPIAGDDSTTTPEDTPVVIAVLTNDSDPDGDPLVVTGASAAHGTVAINPDGTLTYTPSANYNGSDTIRYAISDGQGGTADATVAVTVTPVDDAPDAVGTLPPRATTDGASVSYATAGGFGDVDGDALRYTASGLPAGLTIDPATGVVACTLDRSASQANGGHYAAIVTARDPSNASATQTFTIDVANPAPTAADDAATTHVDTPVTIAVLGDDIDPDGDPLALISAGGASHGSVAVNPDGLTLRYTPAPGYAGSDTLRYTISDGQGGTATANVTVTIANAAPVAAPAPPVAARDGETIVLPLAARFSDPDGDPLTFSATGLPPGLSIDPATGTVTGTIDHAASRATGGYDSVVTANDGHGGSTSATVHWSVTNPAPTARDDRATTTEDRPIVIAVLANDSDPDGDPLTVVAASAAHGSALVNPDGSITYMPAPDFNGTDTVTYTTDDGDGGRATATVTVTVTPANDAPSTAGLAPRSSADGGAVSVPVAPSFGDVDRDTLRYTAIGLPPGLTIDPATGVIGGTIAAGSAYGGPSADGVYHAVVTATDPSGATATAPFDWSVTQAAPLARDDHATTPEDTPVTIPVLANDTDADGDPLTIVATTATHGTAYVTGGNLVFYPAPDFTGVATVTYTIADPAGNRSTATVTIDVTPVNDAPVASPIPAARASDAQPIALDVGGFFRDPDGDALRFAATGLPPGLVIDPATGRIGGTIDHAASRVPGGVYHVTVAATDPSGAASSSTFDWTIVNPAPTARDDAATTPEDTVVVIPVLASDSDPDGDPLTVVSASAGHGRVAIAGDGQLTYTPDADFTGNDVIVYTIDDGDGGRADASVLVTVTPVNDAPVALQPRPADVATTDSAALALDTALWFRDPDGDALSFAATGLPPGLAIDPATGAIRGTLDRSASQAAGGVYHVVVTARDPSGAGTAALFDIRVTDPAPVARDDAATTTEDGPGVIIAVLDNDRDSDGDPLRVTSATADHGTVTMNRDGTVRYVPNASFSGADTVHYTISDGEGGTASATVAITVVPVEHPPVAGNLGPVDAIGGRPVAIAVLPSASDPDGDPLSVVAASTATGTVRVNPDNTVTFTPPLGFVGTTTIGYTVSDGRGGTAGGTVTVRVADGRGADIEQLLRIGRVTFRDPTPTLAIVTVRDGTIRTPLSLIETVEDIRALRGTTIGDHPVGDAVAAIDTLRGTTLNPDMPVLAEVARLERLRDQRDAGDRLFDQRWGDFLVKGLTGFSAADDRNACVMVETVVHGGAIYLDVRDTAAEGARAPIRSVDVRLAGGGRVPDWIRVDPRGMAIIERGADMDELHLVVRVTRADGRTTSTPIVVQGATGEVELDRHAARHGHGRPLDATLHTPSAAIQSEAARLASYFQ